MNLFKDVHKSWIPLLHSLAYEETLMNFLNNLSELSYQPMYEKIFKVFQMPVNDIKLVILGKEPYPIPGLSNGLAYAINQDNKIPKILKCVKSEIFKSNVDINNNFYENTYNNLEHLEKQGVFLLNSALTVETANSGSHLKYWKKFTERVISFISEEKPCIWLLWGRQALSFSPKIINPLLIKGYDNETIEEIPIDPKLNYIIPGKNPIISSMGGMDFSNNGFYYTNQILEKRSLKKITW